MALIQNLNLLAKTTKRTLFIRSPVDQLNYELFNKTIFLLKSVDGKKKNPCIPDEENKCGLDKKIKSTPPKCDVPESTDNSKNQNCHEILKNLETIEKGKTTTKDSICYDIEKKSEVPDKREKGTDSLCEEIFKNDVKKKDDNSRIKKPTGVPGCSCSFVYGGGFLNPTFHNKHAFYVKKF